MFWVGGQVVTTNLGPKFVLHATPAESSSATRAGMTGIQAWASLKGLVGVELPVNAIRLRVAEYNRAEALYTLARIAACSVSRFGPSL